MNYFEKNFPGPECLELEKRKSSGKHDCDGVHDQLWDDFKDKCYLCEKIIEAEKPEIDHFRPKKHFPQLRLEWSNLFNVCRYCNDIKGDRPDQLIDCTDPNSNILNRIKLEFKLDSLRETQSTVQVSVQIDSIMAKNTAKLLKEIYSGVKETGSTKPREKAVIGLLNLISDEIIFFDQLIEDFEKSGMAIGTTEESAIKGAISNAAPFSAFKYWVLKEKGYLYNHFFGQN